MSKRNKLQFGIEAFERSTGCGAYSGHLKAGSALPHELNMYKDSSRNDTVSVPNSIVQHAMESYGQPPLVDKAAAALKRKLRSECISKPTRLRSDRGRES